MQLFIPPLGTRLVITRPWTFTLYSEHRNVSVMQALVEPTSETVQRAWPKDDELITDPELQKTWRNFKVVGPAPDRQTWDYETRSFKMEPQVMISWEVDRYPETSEITLAAGTKLIVDRIYIRQGAGDFDSVTFRIAHSPDPRLMPKSKNGTLKGRGRFWAKLADVNRLHCAVEEEEKARA